MNFTRLLQMKPKAVVGRTRQELRKRLERVWVHVVPLKPDERERQIDQLVDGNVTFFPGASDAATPWVLAARFPAEKTRILAAAERLLAGRFDLLGYRDLDFGDPIDWHLDPVSGRRAPAVHWSLLHPLDAERIGDAKVTWELGRHQWLVTLAQAWALSRDERYAEAALAQLEAWAAANPEGVGIHWTSSLEAAFRIISWSWMLVLLRGSPALGRARLGRIVEMMAAHASRVERFLSHDYSPNTHLTGEALGLVYAGTVLGELDAAPRWRAAGHEILGDQLRRQVAPDGVYFEQSTCYQRYTVEIYLHWRLLRGLAGDSGLDERLAAMVEFLLHVRRPDGVVPAIGDADGGWLLPLSARAPGDLRGIFSTTAVALGRGDHAWAAGGLAPETLWMLGPSAALGFPEASLPLKSRSQVFPQGGWAVLGDGWGDDGHHVIFDVGPLGCPDSSGHGHADLLSLQVSWCGEPLVVDAGTGSYADPAWRDHFRSTAAHSSVVVDGRDQATPTGPFSWKARPAARLLRWTTSPGYDLAVAEHDAWAPIVHRRTVVFDRRRPAWLIIIDELTSAAPGAAKLDGDHGGTGHEGGDGEHDVEVGFQLAPGVAVSSPGPLGGGVRLSGARGAEVNLQVRGAAIVTRIGDGWVSPDYGQRIPALRLAFSTRARFPLRLVTVFKACAASQES